MMSIRSIRALAATTLAVSALTLPACGARGPSEVTSSSKEALINGTPATSDILRSAMLLYLDGKGSWCTAVRVGPRHILTAAHCVVGPQADGTLSATLLPGAAAGSPIWYTRAPAVPAGSVDMYIGANVVSTVIAPSFALSCASMSCPVSRLYTDSIPDIAVITVDRDMDGSVGTAYVDTQSVDDGATVTLSGYGCTDGSWAQPDPRELRYGVSQTLSAGAASTGAQPIYPTNPLLFGQTYALTPGASFGSSSSTSTPSVCPGDSGGPLYRDSPTSNGVERVVGVNSGILFDSAQIANLNYHTRIHNGQPDGGQTLSWLQSILPSSSFY